MELNKYVKDAEDIGTYISRFTEDVRKQVKDFLESNPEYEFSHIEFGWENMDIEKNVVTMHIYYKPKEHYAQEKT